MRLFPFPAHGFVYAGLLIFAGCGGETGLVRYDISGQITYEGKAVPGGRIRFTPDKSQGNQGPTSSAKIVDGHYKTRAGRGTIGGPHLAKIEPRDGVGYELPFGEWEPRGRLLFPKREISVELSKNSDTVHDFDLVAAEKTINEQE